MKRLELLSVVLILFVVSVCFIQALPRFSEDYSFVVYDRAGNLLNAQVASDEQWRFPQREPLSRMYRDCAIVYEDKNFYFHFGIDPISVVRALYLNVKHQRVVSGASTLTMQVARISEKNKPRTFKQKLKESFLSLLIECAYNKGTILNLYANNAPYGGNVVGISAASRRYFSRSQTDLSIAEVATLSVLPNEPALVRPGANAPILQAKRDAVLRALVQAKRISADEYALALLEAVPEEPKALPNIVPHYAQFLKSRSKKNFAEVTIDVALQQRAAEIMETASLTASRSNVYNACAIIMENSTGNIIAYIGNTGITKKNRPVQNEAVDIVQARRSSGSLLKPFLYAASLDASIILPAQLLPDTPAQFGSFVPQNNTHYFLGAVSADEALTKSLNVPFVHLLGEYSIENFLELLRKLRLTTLTNTADYYGLPLILGGGEITLFEIVRAYRNLTVTAFEKDEADFPISSAACRITFDVLLNGVRPAEEKSWTYFSSSKHIAWKTGTSYGNKDAWSVGCTPDYTVGVWFGNASGVGRPEISSSVLAAPAMFKLFELLPDSVMPPRNELRYTRLRTCSHSGFAASPYCDDTELTEIPKTTLIGGACPYCKPVALTRDEKYRITDTGNTAEIPVIKHFFTLPPAQEYYYSQAHPDYRKLPPKLETVQNNSADFQIIYPKNYSKIFIPIDLDGKPGAFAAKAAYLEKNGELFWFLDNRFLVTTQDIHEVKISTSYGKHRLTVVDAFGNEQTLEFFVLSE